MHSSRLCLDSATGGKASKKAFPGSAWEREYAESLCYLKYFFLDINYNMYKTSCYSMGEFITYLDISNLIELQNFINS